ENTVAAQVSNLQPSRKGLMSAMHKWGGIYRDVEIEATPQTFIDDAWVRGDFDRREAEVHVAVCGDGEAALRITIDGEPRQFAPDPSGAYRMPLAEFRPWSPESPNLYTAKVELVVGGETVQTRFERFGVRKLEVRGKEFLLNGRPFYFRGFGDDHVYPISGATVPDRDLHRAHLAKARAAGFNFVRLHTHCEVPEYFDAADELGIMIQPELPYYNDQTCEGFEFDPVRDVTELWENYRRHPSFAVYSMGNEGTFGRELDEYMHRYVKTMDPDRLKINQDSHLEYYNPPESSDYLGGPIDVWERGSFDPDRPFITHEYLNLCIKLDSGKESRYTGAWMPPVTREMRERWLAGFGIGMEWGDRLQYAQHKLQAYYQKRGIEAARSDPYCDGHIFWTIVDVVVAQGASYTAQGLFDPFWETKDGGLSPEEFAVFNSPACVLADFEPSGNILVSGEKLSAKIKFADFRENPQPAGRAEWELSGAGAILAGGREEGTGGFSFEVPALEKPVKASLKVKISGVENAWDFWLFPKREKKALEGVAAADALYDRLSEAYSGLMRESEASKAEVVIAQAKSALATSALERGQKVIAIGRAEGEPNVSLGWWFMGKQVGTALADSPVFGELPKDGYLTKLFFRILKTGQKLPLPGLDNEDIFMLGEGGTDMFLYLGQAKCGTGRILMSNGLDLLSLKPEAVCLMDGMIAYAKSSAFDPKGEIEAPAVKEYSGWMRTISAPDTYDAYLPSDVGMLSMARGDEARNELKWLSRPVPADVRSSPVYEFEFKGGMGYRSEPPVSAAIFMNGEKMADIPDFTWEDAEWEGE
ncbi:MAG: hypothetical protein ILO34_06665, partial [Kiritimatiellae bacterium]|nr:hypothetical protein [Kiritimatiellia bacterium]